MYLNVDKCEEEGGEKMENEAKSSEMKKVSSTWCKSARGRNAKIAKVKKGRVKPRLIENF
jgi:hypothetical protein